MTSYFSSLSNWFLRITDKRNSKEKEKFLKYFENGNNGSVLARKLSRNSYMLIETPLVIESELYEYGTIVSVKKGVDRALWITKVISKSNYNTEIYSIDKDFKNTVEFKEFSRRLSEAGGTFDIAMGGALSIYTPKHYDSQALWKFINFDKYE